MIGIAFISFDFKVGPVPIYFKNITKSQMQMIAIKSMVSTMSMVSGERRETESIIPYPNQLKVVYSYLFDIPSDEVVDKNRSSAFVLIFHSSHQAFLYKIANALAVQFSKLGQKFKTSFIFGENLPDGLQQEFDQFSDIKYLESLLDQETFIQEDQPASKQASLPSFNFIINKLKKGGFNKIINALIVGEPIVVYVDDIGVAEIVMKSLEIFTPHRTLMKSPWQLYYVTGDLVIGPKELLESVPKNVIALDLLKGEVRNGRNNSFIDKIMKEADKESQNNSYTTLIDHINEIISNIQLLINMVSGTTQDLNNKKSDISKFIKQLSKGEYEIITQLLKKDQPQIFNSLRKIKVI